MTAIPKPKPFRSARYRQFIRDIPCIVCSKWSQPHHENIIGHGGVGTKAGDDRCLPLCFTHHRERHDRGRVVWEEWGIDPEEVINQLWEGWSNK